MTPEQWARVKEVFNAALAQEASARAAFIAEATSDESVRAEVERLLDADLHAADFIEHPAAATLLSGRVISHYEIGHLLGSGGMGRVYAARDTELGREVALKVASLDSQDAQARLRREAQHASRLSHPHICHIYEVGRADGQLFIVMELVQGRSLADVIRDGPLPVATAKQYGAEIADALAHAHERGVTHRDLKCTNVMITSRGAKVLDFGLARMLDAHQIDALSHSQRSLTGDGMIAGTLPYMAPELLRGERGDQRADIWALGVLLYEMVGGRRPFTGRTGFELSAAILHQAPETLPANVPAPLADIIQRCLAKDPVERYQQAVDVHVALREMKGAARIARTRIPAIPRRLVMGALLLVAILTIAAFAAWRIGSGVASIGSQIFSNARGYSLLQAGEFEQAVEQFRAVADQEPAEENSWDSLGEGYLASGMPDKALEAYLRALSIEPTFDPSILGRALALAALGRYDEALDKTPLDVAARALLLSRAGRYGEAAQALEAGRREFTEDKDLEGTGSTVLISSWLSMERAQHARALVELRAAETVLGQGARDESLLVFADLLGGIAEIRAGNVPNAVTRLGSQKSRHDSDDPVESNWVAALEGEIALAQGQYDLALASFDAAHRRAWPTLGREAVAMFAINAPSRDGRARVEIARGNRAPAVEEYRRLTAAGPGGRSAVLEPRHVLALARLLDEGGDGAGARLEYGRFLKLWAKADDGLPEIEEARRAIARLASP
jgi:tetratricopeptide (TPR) repeat protein/predicted Ser/Thr protein kinase